MLRSFSIKIASVLFFTALITNLKAQSASDALGNSGVPFLTITPESRGGAMGDVGAATTPDIYSQYWNPSKYAFLDRDMEASISFTPWLRKLVNDINLYYVTYFKRIDKMQTFSASLRYFSLGSMTYTGDDGYTISQGNPNQFSIDLEYARKLSENFSGSILLRYLRSDIANGATTEDFNAANAYAADLSFFYIKDVKWGGKRGNFSAGLNLSNLGSKISYTDGETKNFQPSNLKLGAGYKTEIDKFNKVGISLDMNRLMVTNSEDDADISMPASFFKSIGQISLNDLMFSLGGEYIYADQFALRAGYYYESEALGNGKFATAGAGITFNMITLDASYIITMASTNPLSNTIRFSLAFDIDQMTGKKRR